MGAGPLWLPLSVLKGGAALVEKVAGSVKYLW
jgi:hypothetical protein